MTEEELIGSYMFTKGKIQYYAKSIQDRGYNPEYVKVRFKYYAIKKGKNRRSRSRTVAKVHNIYPRIPRKLKKSLKAWKMSHIEQTLAKYRLTSKGGYERIKKGNAVVYKKIL